MTILAALPRTDALPAPLWLITALHVLTLTLHLLAMNLLVGGLVVTLFGRIPAPGANPAVRRYLKIFPGAMAATVTLGVAPLLFAQLVYGGPLYSAAIVSAWLWLLIPIVVMVAYYLLYAAAFAKPSHARIRLWLVFALLGLLYVSVVYSGVFSLAEDPALQKAVYRETQSGLAFHPDLGAWAVRWLHMVTGAVTVGAFFFGWIGRDDAVAFAAAKRVFLYGFVVASVVGVVYLVTLGDRMRPFMRSPGIWAVLIGFVLGLGSLHFLFKQRFVPAFLLTFGAVLGMVVARHVLRDLTLAGQFDAAAAQVSPQWGPFALFLVCFVAALGTIAWMVRLFMRERAGPAV